MSAAPAPVVLDRAAAQLLTRQLRDALQLAVDLVQRAIEGRAWLALGYESWADYCAAELPQLAELVKRAPVDERRGVVVALRDAGHSLRAIAQPLGLAPNTVRADLAAAGADQLATVTSLDGRVRPATSTAAPKPKPKARPLVDRIVELLAAEPGGLDVLAVSKALRVRQAQAGPALCRLGAAGRVEYVPGAKRGQLGRYRSG